MRLEGKAALVTGGASGFGAEIVLSYVREGAKVVILDLNGNGAQKIADAAGGGADRGGRRRDEAIRHRRRGETGSRYIRQAHIVINNAGWTFRNKPMLEVSEAEFDKVFAINVKSIFLITNAVVPVRGNRRVVASSTSARQQVLVRGLD